MFLHDLAHLKLFYTTEFFWVYEQQIKWYFSNIFAEKSILFIISDIILTI